MDNQQAQFEGWAVIELFGHAKEIGPVTTAYFGGSAMFRCDVPELPEREFVLTSPEYVEGEWMAAGTKVKRQGTPARTRLIGPGAVYAMTPCTEEFAREALERSTHRPLIVLDRPAKAAIAAANAEIQEDIDTLIAFGDDDEDDDEDCA